VVGSADPIPAQDHDGHGGHSHQAHLRASAASPAEDGPDRGLQAVPVAWCDVHGLVAATPSHRSGALIRPRRAGTAGRCSGRRRCRPGW
jgi:hypothetical protein